MLNQEKHIIHQLLLKSCMGKDIGLYHGKMELILFFAHYYELTGLRVFDIDSDDLLVKILTNSDAEKLMEYKTRNFV